MVDPPSAWSTVIAFSKEARVRMVWGVKGALVSCGDDVEGIMETISEPVCSAIRMRAEDVAGAVALPRGARPSDSTMHAIVDAVPFELRFNMDFTSF